MNKTKRNEYIYLLYNFYPIPIIKLPFHSIVVASEDDSYVSVSRAEYFAKSWNSDFINIGEWEEGLRILETLPKKVKYGNNTQKYKRLRIVGILCNKRF